MDTEETQDIETRIIEAAKCVFVRKGYEATKMGDIAEEIDISRTALHYYFRTKEMLFEAIFGQLMGLILPNIDAVMDESTTCLEKIPKIVSRYISVVQANPSFPIFVMNEFNRDPEHLYRTVMKDPSRILPIVKLRKQLLDEMEKGMLKKIPLIHIASTMIGMIVFPMLASHPLTTIFLNGDSECFQTFIEERKAFVSDLMVQMLTPDNK